MNRLLFVLPMTLACIHARGLLWLDQASPSATRVARPNLAHRHPYSAQPQVPGKLDIVVANGSIALPVPDSLDWAYPRLMRRSLDSTGYVQGLCEKERCLRMPLRFVGIVSAPLSADDLVI